jgi:hypothetical protein
MAILLAVRIQQPLELMLMMPGPQPLMQLMPLLLYEQRLAGALGRTRSHCDYRQDFLIYGASRAHRIERYYI